MAESDKKVLKLLEKEGKALAESKSSIKYQIREMQGSDIQAVHDFFTENHKLPGFKQMAKDYFSIEELTQRPHALVAVNDDGELLGAILFKEYQEEDINANTISCLGVKPDKQGQLIGQNLLRAGIELTEQLGNKEIGLVASGDDESRFYQQKGGFEVDPGGDDDTELCLQKGEFGDSKRTIEIRNASRGVEVTIDVAKVATTMVMNRKTEPTEAKGEPEESASEDAPPNGCTH
jgi:ribosomal protein S18 acetylase RimI-like enzyme